ncbi:hypothetical protein [Pseudomonas sp.]|uniref:hypothetical protein n=1 Tax=Pseudomonas sp. TaxID=306 RepID=UPI002FC893D6
MENQNHRTLAEIMADNKNRDRIEYINKNIGDLYDEQIRIIQGILAGEKIMPESLEHFAYLLMRFAKAIPASVSAATIEKRPRVKISDIKVGQELRFAKSEQKRIRGNVATTKCRTGMDFFLSVDDTTGELVVKRTY